MKKNYFSLFIFFLTLFSASLSNAQRLEYGISVGGTNYQGDIGGSSISAAIKNIHQSFGLHGAYYFNSRIGIRTGLGYSIISGSDADDPSKERQKRNLSFQSNIFDTHLAAEINLLKYEPEEDRAYTLYGFGGLAGFRFNPQAKLNGKLLDLQPLGTEGQGLPQYPAKTKYSLFSGAFCFGGGLKFALSEQWNLAFEGYGLRSWSDYVDDVSGDYASEKYLNTITAQLANRTGQIPGTERIVFPEGSGRGNRKVKDYVTVGRAVLTYNLYNPTLGGGKGRKGHKRGGTGCPTF
jgi:hypothetical protein